MMFVQRRPPSVRQVVLVVALGTLVGSEAFVPLAFFHHGTLALRRPSLRGGGASTRIMSAFKKGGLHTQDGARGQTNLVLKMGRQIGTWLLAHKSSSLPGESGWGDGREVNDVQGGGRLGSSRWNESVVASRSALLVQTHHHERKNEVPLPPPVSAPHPPCQFCQIGETISLV